MMRRKRSPSPRARLSVEATSDGVRHALDAFSQFCGSLELSSDAEWRFLVALDEILANIVAHAQPEDPIGLRFSLTKRELKVEVVDTADRFNPLTTAAPDLAGSLESRSPGGLGIAIVRGLMDRVEYQRRAGKNRLGLVWRVRPAGNRPSRTAHAD